MRDEDTESGKGASLPQSPHGSASAAAVGDSSGPRSVDSDFEDSRQDYRTFPDVALSLCGQFSDNVDPPEDLFLKSLVSCEEFIENPRLMENPDLVVRIGNKYYTWKVACPIVMGWVVYQHVLPQPSIDALVHEYMPKREEKKTESVPAPARSSWFPWGRRAQPKKESSEVGGNPNITTQPEVSGSEAINITNQKVETDNPPVRPSTVDISANGSSSDNESDGSTGANTGKKLPMGKRPYLEKTDVYCKTLRLTNEQIVSRTFVHNECYLNFTFVLLQRQLNLREGSNEAMFSVTTAFQGTTRCKCHIYLWRYDDKIVISDIDGTITKYDFFTRFFKL